MQTVMRRVQLLVIVTVVSDFGTMPLVVQAQQPGQPVRQVVGNGTASIDVFAQDVTVDLLTTQRDGEDMQLHHQRSVDGGETWGPVRVIDTTTKPISIASRGNEPQIVAYLDHIAVHWSTKGTARFGAGPMVTAVSDDAGRSWRLGPNPAGADSGGAQNFADMTADAEGTFYVAWIGSHDGPAGRGLGVARSTDFGETWEQSQLVDTSSCACCWNRMVTPRTGSVRVLYRDYGVRDMALASTDDGGLTWSLDGTVGRFNWEFSGCPHVGGGITVAVDGEGAEQLHALAWTGHEEQHGLYWLRSSDDGLTWTAPQRMGGELARHADIGAAGRTVLAAWDENRAVWASLSHDVGDRWNAPRRLSNEGTVASHPIVIHASDTFRVFWTERDQHGLRSWRSRRLAGEWVAAHRRNP